MRHFSVGTLLVVTVALSLTGLVLGAGFVAVSFAADPDSRPLDLPSGGKSAGTDFDSVEEPLVGAVCFGFAMEAPAIHFCFSSYSEAGLTPDSTFMQIQTEVVAAITEIGAGVQVSATSYDCYEETTPPVAVDETNRSVLVEWVQSQSTMGIQHVIGAAVQAIGHANTLGIEGQRIVIIARGSANDLAGIEEIATANLANNWPIDVIYIPSVGVPGATEWQTLAASQGGQFHLVAE